MRIKDLKRVFKVNKKDDVHALKGLNFDLPETGIVFLLGKSGCGKTTLLNILGGLDRATSGEVIYKGRNLAALSQKELNEYRNGVCGFIFQEYNVIPELTVGENIALAMQLQGEKDTAAHVSEVLKKVELEGYEGRKVTQLSGGQKQRVAIARALVKNSEIIFADEPTGALDSQTGESIFGLLKEISKDKLVVVVSHDREFAEKYADRIIELKDGEIISDSENSFAATEKEPAPVNKSGKAIPFRSAFNIGIKTFAYHPFRMFFCIFFSVLCFMLLGISVSLSFVNSETVFFNALVDNNVKYGTMTKQQYDGYYDSSVLGVFNGQYRSYEHRELNGDDYRFLLERFDREGFVAVSEEQSVADFQRQMVILVENRDKYLEIYRENADKMLINVTLKGFVHVPEKDFEELGYDIVGELPAEDTGVAVPVGVYNAYKLFGYEYEGEKYEINSPEDLIGKLIRCNYSNTILPEYRTITGIVYPDCKVGGCDDPEHYLHDKFFVHEDFGHFKYVEFTLPSSRAGLKDMVSFLFNYEDEEGVFFSLSSGIHYDTDDSETYLYKIAGAYIGGVIGVLSVILLGNFIAVSIKTQRRQIGILKSLGAGKGSLIRIYLTSAGVTGGIIFVLSYIMTLVGNFLTNKYILAVDATHIINYLPFNALTPLILLALVAAAVTVSCIVPILVAAKKYPSEHLR